MDTLDLSFWTPIFDGTHNGFSYAGKKLSEALERKGVKVRSNDPSEIAIAFMPPYLYENVEADYIIGYTPWETTSIPIDWMPHFDLIDEFWTTSEFCKEVFNKFVSMPIEVVYHGIDPQDYTLKRRKWTTGTQFNFLHIGEPAEHKGGQLVADAFNNTFNGYENVRLIMKGVDFISARNRAPFGPVTYNPRIEVRTQILPVDAMNSLYHSAQCLVYPSHCEGFGLIPLQGIFTGIPTIMTPWSAMAEYSEYGIPIDYKISPAKTGFYEGYGDWAEPDLKSLCNTMQMVYNNYEEYASKAFNNAVWAQEDPRYNWDNIADKVLELLRRR